MSICKRYLLLFLALSLELSAQIPVASVAVNKGQLHISVEKFPTGKHWALAMSPEDRTDAQVTPSKVLVRDTPDWGPHIYRSADLILDGKAFSESDGMVNLRSPEDGSNLVVKIVAPVGCTISVTYGDTPVFLGTLSGATDIIDGLVAPGSAVSFPKLITELMHPALIESSYGGDFFSGSQTRVTSVGLHRHLIVHPAPLQIPPNLGPPTEEVTKSWSTVVEVTIAPDGKIQDAAITGGSDALGHAALVALQPVRFKPFLIEGKAVTVNSRIVFALSRELKPFASIE